MTLTQSAAPAEIGAAPSGGALTSRWALRLVAVDVVLATIASAAIVDLRVHAAVQERYGVNAWGFRGRARFHRIAGERRIAIVGGTAAYAPDTPWRLTFPVALETRVNQAWRPQYPGRYTSVLNLAEPGSDATGYLTTIRRYAYLDADVFLLYDDGSDDAAPPPDGRERSFLFRRIGYFPILLEYVRPRAPWLIGRPAIVPEDMPRSRAADSGTQVAALAAAVETIIGGGHVAVVAIAPNVAPAGEAFVSAVSVLRARYGADPRFAYEDLRRDVDLRQPEMSPDGVRLTPRAQEQIAEALTPLMLTKVEVR